MAHLSLTGREIVRKKKIMALYLQWLNIMHVVQWFYKLFERIITTEIESNSLRGQLYILDVIANRQIVHQITYESEVTCLDQLRLTREAFTNLCTLLETRGGLIASS